jgi:hypothetical protein
MATDKYPSRNVSMPLSQRAVDQARAKLDPGRSVSGPDARSVVNGKGSRRQVRPGEWIDDRVIVIDGPASPSDDNGRPPLKAEAKPRALPSFDSTKVYQVTLGKVAVFAGRNLSPGKQYEMVGDVCIELQASICAAIELGTIPQDPDVTPSRG